VPGARTISTASPTKPSSVAIGAGSRASGGASSDSAADTSSPGHHKLSTTATANGLEIKLRVDRPVGDYKTFWVDNPRRLVVDIPGGHSALDATEYKLSNPLASRVRVGVHGDKVRFVVDTTDKTSESVQAHAHGQTLVIGLAHR
jgi:hypothetical protein